MGGPDFSLDSDGGLYINSPSGHESGEFICMATNAAGHASRRVQLTVYGKPASHPHQIPPTIHAFGSALSLTRSLVCCLCLQCVPDPTPEVLEALQSQSECQRLRGRTPSCHVRSTASRRPPSAGPGRGTLSPHSPPGKTEAG